MRVFNKIRFSLDLKRKMQQQNLTFTEAETITKVSRSVIYRACQGKNIEIESFANLLLFINEEAEYYFDNEDTDKF